MVIAGDPHRQRRLAALRVELRPRQGLPVGGERTLYSCTNHVIIHLQSCCNSQVNGLNDTAHSIEQIEWLEQLEAAATLPGSEQRWEVDLTTFN